MYLILFSLWIIFNAKVTLEIVVIGLLVSGLIYVFMIKFMDYSIVKDIRIMKKIPLFVEYVCILIYEIIKANFATIHMITTSKYQIEPYIFHFKTKLQTKTANVILANSITLTPGTITVSLEENELVVHCLDKDFSKGIEDSKFIRLLERLEE